MTNPMDNRQTDKIVFKMYAFENLMEYNNYALIVDSIKLCEKSYV